MPGLHRRSRSTWVVAALALLVATQGSAALAELSCYQNASDRVEDARRTGIRNLNTTYEMPTYRTLEDWQVRREWLRTHARVACGLWPMPTPAPVEAAIYGRVDREGYSVEKVTFESRPGLYVSGNLYRPAGRPGPHPAVACPHGHWTRGRIEHSDECSAPGRAIGLARRGIIAFSYDMVGFLDCDQLPHGWHEDRLDLWGISAAGLQTLNSTRVLDFLCSLPDVDPSRIGVTGASGGATQTFLLAAVDPRVAASVPVNMVSAHFQGGCICENPPGLRVETFNPEIASIMAPKPELLISCTGDWSAMTPTVEGPMLRSIYGLYGEPGNVQWVQENAGHNYNRASRQHAYRFLHEAFFGEPDPSGGEEAPFTPEPDEALRVWSDREPPSDRLDLTHLTAALVEDRKRVVDGLFSASPDERRETAELLRTAYEHALLVERPAADRVTVEGLATEHGHDWSCRRLVLGREGHGDAVPALLFEPTDAPVRGAVLLVGEGGKGEFLDGGGAGPGRLARALLAAGRAVLAIDPFGVGEAAPPAGAPDRAAGVEYFTTYNRVDAAERVQDVLTGYAYLEGRLRMPRTGIVGTGKAGLWCALAMPYLPRECRLAADLCGLDRSDDAPFLHELPIPLLRQAGDFATALACAGPGQLRLWDLSASALAATHDVGGGRTTLTVDHGRPDDQDLAAWLT